MATTNKEDTIIRHIVLSWLPEKWHRILADIRDSQSLGKLAVAADKMVDVTSEDVHIASIQTRDSPSKTETLKEVMQYGCKISEKLDTVIDIVKDGFTPASPVRGRNYSTSRYGWRYFVPSDRGYRNSLSDSKNKKEHSVCHIYKKNSETDRGHFTHPAILQIRKLLGR